MSKITKNTPRKYWVNHKWRTQETLLRSAPRDEVSQQLIEDRDQSQKQKAAKKEKKHMKKRYKEVKKAPAGLRRSKRGAAEDARIVMLQRREEEKETEAALEIEDVDDEKAEIVEDMKQLEAQEKKLGIKRKKAVLPAKEVTVKGDKADKYRAWLKRRGLPVTGAYAVLKKRIKLKQKLDDLKKKVLRLKGRKV